MNRRSFLVWANGVLGGIVGLVVAVPLLGPLLDPVLRKQGSGERPRVDVGPVDQFKPGTVTQTMLVTSKMDGPIKMPPRPDLGVFVIRDTAKTITVDAEGRSPNLKVLSRECPHLGCNVDYDKANGFLCPCHNSRFATEFEKAGTKQEIRAGATNPSPRRLDSLDARIEDGRLVIEVVHFRPGRPQAEPRA
ncbi:MAG: hypothetical protein CMH54_10560 [Myxococcales bacterium]|nr:hypothetical protein [Myxococcales bacterium]